MVVVVVVVVVGGGGGGGGGGGATVVMMFHCVSLCFLYLVISSYKMYQCGFIYTI